MRTSSHSNPIQQLDQLQASILNKIQAGDIEVEQDDDDNRHFWIYNIRVSQIRQTPATNSPIWALG